MEADEHNTLMILSPVWTPARIAAPSGKHGGKGSVKSTDDVWKEIKQMEEWNERRGNRQEDTKVRFHGAFVDISGQWIQHIALTDQMLQSDYLSAILKDHNSGYITRRTCFTAPPQTKGFRHETGYYEIYIRLYSQQQTAEVFCKPNSVFLIDYLWCAFWAFGFVLIWTFWWRNFMWSFVLTVEGQAWLITWLMICQYVIRYLEKCVTTSKA